MMQNRSYLITIFICGLFAATFVYWHTQQGIKFELKAYRTESSKLTDTTLAKVELSFDEIYISIRTIARLPGIRSHCFNQHVDRDSSSDNATFIPSMDHGGGLLEESTRITIQEIYNSLVQYVSVSELYIIPSNLDPDGLDPTHSSPREPIITFDELIINRNATTQNDTADDDREVEEIEIYEYRMMRSQLDWFNEHYPSESRVSGLQYPMLAGSEVITCDNTFYNPVTNFDDDRSGMVFAVPYFDVDGKFSGSIACVILSKVLCNPLRSGNYSLFNTTYDYFLGASAKGQWHRSNAKGNGSMPDETLLYSEVRTIKSNDFLNTWSLWAGFSDEQFWLRTGVQAILKTRYLGFLGVACFTFGATIVTLLLLRSRQRLVTLNNSLEATVVERTSSLLKSRNDAFTALEREQDTATKLNRVMVTLEKLATTDKLTGLPNRAIILDRLEHAIQQSSRHSNRFALLFIDFDRFKLINDNLGHQVGDKLLCSIADIFRNEMRESDTAARFGGDEFLILLENLTNWSDAKLKAERLLAVFSKPHHIDEHQILSTASIGLVTNERKYETTDDMIRDADIAMYQAKQNGKAQVVSFDETMHQEVMLSHALEEDLQIAIDNNQFNLVYQPIIELDDGKLHAFEALIRWDHPELGLVSPADFIPLAEETGLIIPIGNWVLHTAAAQLSEWNQKLRADCKLQMSVNVSKRQLMHPSFISELIACQQNFDLSPGELIIEISETTLVEDIKNAVPLLTKARETGSLIAIDDFGVGITSLGGIDQVPVDILKFEQAFIRAVTKEPTLLPTLSSMTKLAKHLGIQTIAERIEDAETCQKTQSIGCSLGQGYHFAKPLSSIDAKAFIEQHCSNQMNDAA